MDRWVMGTALGRPVDPDVKITYAMPSAAAQASTKRPGVGTPLPYPGEFCESADAGTSTGTRVTSPSASPTARVAA
ncbi:hypothetical protein SBADM41S_06166 [Streptomyces badius]